METRTVRLELNYECMLHILLDTKVITANGYGHKNFLTSQVNDFAIVS